MSTKGFVSDDDLADVRAAGYDDGEIGEIVAAVALNTFTNYFNSVGETQLDFPAVEFAAQ
jgi:alkylhydroperoxidase family enzyme